MVYKNGDIGKNSTAKLEESLVSDAKCLHVLLVHAFACDCKLHGIIRSKDCVCVCIYI